MSSEGWKRWSDSHRDSPEGRAGVPPALPPCPPDRCTTGSCQLRCRCPGEACDHYYALPDLHPWYQIPPTGGIISPPGEDAFDDVGRTFAGNPYPRNNPIVREMTRAADQLFPPSRMARLDREPRRSPKRSIRHAPKRDKLEKERNWHGKTHDDLVEVHERGLLRQTVETDAGENDSPIAEEMISGRLNRKDRYDTALWISKTHFDLWDLDDGRVCMAIEGLANEYSPPPSIVVTSNQPFDRVPKRSDLYRSPHYHYLYLPIEKLSKIVLVGNRPLVTPDQLENVLRHSEVDTQIDVLNAILKSNQGDGDQFGAIGIDSCPFRSG